MRKRMLPVLLVLCMVFNLFAPVSAEAPAAAETDNVSVTETAEAPAEASAGTQETVSAPAESGPAPAAEEQKDAPAPAETQSGEKQAAEEPAGETPESTDAAVSEGPADGPESDPEAPASGDVPASGDTPASGDVPASEDIPASGEDPAPEDTPASEDIPAVFEASYAVLKNGAKLYRNTDCTALYGTVEGTALIYIFEADSGRGALHAALYDGENTVTVWIRESSARLLTDAEASAALGADISARWQGKALKTAVIRKPEAPAEEPGTEEAVPADESDGQTAEEETDVPENGETEAPAGDEAVKEPDSPAAETDEPAEGPLPETGSTDRPDSPETETDEPVPAEPDTEDGTGNDPEEQEEQEDEALPGSSEDGGPETGSPDAGEEEITDSNISSAPVPAANGTGNDQDDPGPAPDPEIVSVSYEWDETDTAEPVLKKEWNDNNNDTESNVKSRPAADSTGFASWIAPYAMVTVNGTEERKEIGDEIVRDDPLGNIITVQAPSDPVIDGESAGLWEYTWQPMPKKLVKVTTLREWKYNPEAKEYELQDPTVRREDYAVIRYLFDEAVPSGAGYMQETGKPRGPDGPPSCSTRHI